VVRAFVADRVLPHVGDWFETGTAPRELFPELGNLGVLGMHLVGYGCAETNAVSYGLACLELEAGDSGLRSMVSVQGSLAMYAIWRWGSEEQKQEWLPRMAAGEVVGCFGLTEPDAGSDVAAIRTRAVRDGDQWVINGSKLYITNGTQADWLCLLVRTGDEGGYRGMSQIAFPTDTPGFSVSRKLRKLGNWSSDTAELSFIDARVPVGNTIGEIGKGFHQQMAQFQNERMIAAYMSIGSMTRALERTEEYLRQRQVFGKPLIANQHLQFRLVELRAEIDLLRHYNYACAEAYLRGEDTTRYATVAKLKAGRLARQVADTCIQFHGGVGYMEETWVSRYFRDSRLLSIGGGVDEVMLRVLARMEGYGDED
jgi:citronellyl-CoA dehydrogenase